MSSKPILIITTLLSALGFALQGWCQTTAFTPEDLPVSGALALPALKLFAAAVPVLAVLLSLPLHGMRPKGEQSLYHGMGALGRAVGVASGGLMILGGLLQLLEDGAGLARGVSFLPMSLCLADALLAAGGGAMIWMALSSSQTAFHVHHSLCALLPGFAGCFWLVLYYHSNSRDPVVLRYCWVLLCLMAAILAFYYQAGFSFDRPRPLRALACSMTAAVYAFTALPDSGSLPQTLLLLAIGLWMLLHCVRIPRRSEVHGQREKHE